MEKQSCISSSKFIGSTLDNVILNSDISLTKMKEAIETLDKASKAIIIPILKIQKKLSLKFGIFAKDYNEIIEKAELANKEIMSHPEESKSDTMNITDIQLNQKYANDHENMINFYENITNNLELFTKLLNSQEYDKLIKGFDNLIPDKEMFIEEEEKEEIQKITKENVKLKKPKKTQVSKSKKIVKRLGNSIKDKKNIIEKPKKKKKDRDLLELLQKNYPTNTYVKKISKTFLSRRLFKKVIYRNIFEFKEDGTVEENKLRSAGESTIYKYGKFTFKFFNDEICNTEKLDELLGKELKQQFAKLDIEHKEYIIAGKVGCLISEFIDKIFKKSGIGNLGVIEATMEFYEFYEELVSEFNDKEKNVRIIFCDEKILKHLREDWKNLEIVRDFVRKKKSEPKD